MKKLTITGDQPRDDQAISELKAYLQAEHEVADVDYTITNQLCRIRISLSGLLENTDAPTINIGIVLNEEVDVDRIFPAVIREALSGESMHDDREQLDEENKASNSTDDDGENPAHDDFKDEDEEADDTED